MNTTPPSGPPLARLAAASWGVCWGVLIATLATTATIKLKGDTQNHSHPALLRCEYLNPYEVVPWQEHYEQSWYVLVCVSGALCAWAAARFVRPDPWLAALAAVAFVPAAENLCRGVFANKLVTGRLMTCVGILALPVLGVLWRRASFLRPSPLAGEGGRESSSGRVRGEAEPISLLHPSPGGEAPPPSPARGEGRKWLTAAVLCVPLVALQYGAFAPADLAQTAWECNVESHVASYLVAPAQYYRAPDAVPGLDFESHYGIGHAWAFSRVMGSGGLQSVLERYVLFVLLVTIAHFVSAHLVLTDWLGNPFAALGVTLALAAVSVEGLGYKMPSCFPVRHPFVFAFLFCAVRGAESTRWALAAGAVGGVSLFWQTDIGLFTLAAGAALYFAGAVFLGGSWLKPGAFLAAGLGTFALICVVLFGPRVLSPAFPQRLMEPLLLYATGFGTALMSWQGGWAGWFNLAGPGLAVASVGAFVSYRRGETPTRGVVYAAAASLLGLAMLTKWVNRSIDILWALNGPLVVAVAGWWAWEAWRAGTANRGIAARLVLGVAVAALAVVALRFDAATATPHPLLKTSSPFVRIANRLDTFPNPINAQRRSLPKTDWPAPFSDDEVAYLRDRTSPTERVVVISRHDWNFLAAAGRAPQLSWQPFFLVHSPVLLDRCAEDVRAADRVFIDHNALLSLAQLHPSAHEQIAPIIAKSFELVEQVGRWSLYARRK
ncbi:unnamed protein product [Gemmataceae bacterium]|nr:unnamed protein product [Gemmataceae bacterium]VTT97518.1 unnamed protein product [Gemmataceae bacterium]